MITERQCFRVMKLNGAINSAVQQSFSTALLGWELAKRKWGSKVLAQVVCGLLFEYIKIIQDHNIACRTDRGTGILLNVQAEPITRVNFPVLTVNSCSKSNSKIQVGNLIRLLIMKQVIRQFCLTFYKLQLWRLAKRHVFQYCAYQSLPPSILSIRNNVPS